jgi:pimeloyl-ACP methyl ester carboxylesterase
MENPRQMSDARIFNRTALVNGHKIFYRESGALNAPTLLLLHGFPSSSHMFRNLIPRLSTQFRVIAPDLPGFGFSDAPDRASFHYTFAHLTKVMHAFTTTLRLERYFVYVFDYGAPVGFRLALLDPDRVDGFISQNGNAYSEGLSENWAPIQTYWREPTSQNRDQLRSFLTLEATRWQYTHGVVEPELIAPESYFLDATLLARPGNDEIQLDLLLDYQTNVTLYPAFQAYFRERQPPLLAVWGKNDPYFIPAGAEAFTRHNKNAEVMFYDTGHFALETHSSEIAGDIRSFLARTETLTNRRNN